MPVPPQTCAAESGISAPVGWYTLRQSLGTPMKANAKTSRPSSNCCATQLKVKADTYTQAVTSVKREAQTKIAKLIWSMFPQPRTIGPKWTQIFNHYRRQDFNDHLVPH